MAHCSPNPQLKITIIGAGLGGLAAAVCLARKGHQVCVLERQKGLSEFGAGLQVTPNAVRLLDDWGLRAAFEEIAFVPNRSVARRYCTGDVIGATHQNPESEGTYGFPYWQIYRPDFQTILAKAASSEGVDIRFDSEVVRLDVKTGKVTLTTGLSITADLCICADGIRSATRGFVLGNEAVTPIPFEEYNYRAMIPSSEMMEDPETAQLMSSRDTQAWLGPGRAIVGYPISKGTLFNLAVSVPRPSDSAIGKWNEPGDLQEFQELFPDFCGLARKVVGLVKQCAKWSIAEVPPLAKWSSESGKAVLLGDAAHAMSPHAAQGSAMALEDTAVLGECLGCVERREDLRLALSTYEAIRKPRVERIAEIARTNGFLWVLPDGPAQEARDKRFRSIMMGDAKDQVRFLTHEILARDKPSPDKDGKWPQPGVLMWVYGYDAIGETRRHLEEGASP